MQNVSRSITIDASPDAVWAIAGDVGAVSTWIPAIESSHLDGDIRHAEFAGGGGSARERIVEVDDAARRYVYEYLDGPLTLDEYRSTFVVVADGSGSRVSWDSTLAAAADEEAGLAEAIGGIYDGALSELAAQAEGRVSS